MGGFAHGCVRGFLEWWLHRYDWCMDGCFWMDELRGWMSSMDVCMLAWRGPCIASWVHV